MGTELSEADREALQALTVVEVAKLLQVSEPSVRQLIKSRQMASPPTGRCRQVGRMDRRDFLAARVRMGWTVPASKVGSDFRPGEAATGCDEFAADEDIPFQACGYGRSRSGCCTSG